MTDRWLSIIGLGEDGLSGLSGAARTLLDTAEVLIGGKRHLAMIPDDGRERHAWPTPMHKLIDDIGRFRGRPVAVLASGDPLCFGVGKHLAKRVPANELTIVPAPSAFSLAAARLGWSLPDTTCFTLHGRTNRKYIVGIIINQLKRSNAFFNYGEEESVNQSLKFTELRNVVNAHF